MEYTAGRLSKLSGVSARALRYYDNIGLLCPKRGENGYRLYDEAQAKTLQRILFFRELGVPLEEIKRIIYSRDYNPQKALEEQLCALKKEKERIASLIANVKSAILEQKGEKEMKDEERFEGFKKALIEGNERKYGSELREKYGDDAIDGSMFKIKGMSQSDWNKAEELRKSIDALIAEAMKSGSRSDRETLFKAHREWICALWKNGTYTPGAHRGLGDMYACDERFKAYYEQRCGDGAAAFLREVIYEFTA